MKILFVGAGAIGSYLGAFLTRAGQDVTLIRSVGRAGRDGPRESIFGHRAARPVRGTAGDLPSARGAAPAARLRHRLRGDEGLRHGVGRPSSRCATSSPRASSWWPPRTGWPDPSSPRSPARSARSASSCSKIGVASWKAGHVERGHERGGTHRATTSFRAGRARRQDHPLHADDRGDAQGRRTARSRPTTSGASAGPSSAPTRWATRAGHVGCSGLVRRWPPASRARDHHPPGVGSPRASGSRSATRSPKIKRHDRRAVGRRRPPRGVAGPGRDADPKSASGRNWKASMAQDVAKAARRRSTT